MGEQVSDVEGHVVQLVDSVIVNGLSATFAVSNNVATAEGDFELCVYGIGNFAGEAKCSYSVGGVVLPPSLTPGDGTIFTESQVVWFSAQTPDSKWYYTLDGSMPTTNSQKSSRVNLHGKTTIRAIAVLDGKLRSAVVEAHYALGACANPTIRLDGQDGCVFHFPEQLVVIDRNGEEGVVRYTLDGNEPTADSPAYAGPFAISASTIVKAKTFSDSWFDSETVAADLRLEVLSVPSPVIQAASEYKGPRTSVSMSCALEGAVIRYTLDGSEPTATSALYEQPFEIGGELGSAIRVRARAVCKHYADSSVAEVAVKRVWGIGDTLGLPDMMFTTDGWIVDPQETFGGRETMRSGPTGDGESNALETVVHGGGVIAFSWRTSCEDSSGDFIWDRAEFWADDVCVAKIEGETSWDGVEYEIPDDGANHVLRWLYVKDPELGTAEGEDCAWLAAVSWAKKDAAPFVIVTEDPNGEIVLPAGKDISEVAVSVMCNGHNIFPYLNLPAAVNGVIDLSLATLKEEIIREPLDTTKGAKIELSADNPKITTAPTKPGLTYTLREGETLGGMKDGDSKVGDGHPWTPEITVKGGNSAFYSIGVGKGE